MSIMNANLRKLNSILTEHQPNEQGCTGCPWKEGATTFPEHQSELVKPLFEKVWEEAYADGQGDESYSWVASGASNDSYRYSIPRTNPYK